MTDSSRPDVQKNADLTPFNTLGIEAHARYFTSVTSVDELQNLLSDSRFDRLPRLVLGGGSNILFVDDFPGLVMHIEIKGREVVREEGDELRVRIGAGENWHRFVRYCVEQGWGGIENLSLIPGSVGAAPIQNIGAYGVELEEVFHSLEAVEIGSGTRREFTHNECRFGYRDSIFKNELKGRFIVTHVLLNLSRNPKLNTSYGAIQSKLQEKDISDPDISDISEVVMEIRRNKLPDPEDLGNAGSFFKNPIVSGETYEKIRKQYEQVPAYPMDLGGVKIPAGWLIEKTGWKGRKEGQAGTYRQQALVIVNHGGATGQQILELSRKIRSAVADQFGIELVPEVNIIDSSHYG